eukprot:4049233-Pleurochrysis_carterae.AAC.2
MSLGCSHARSKGSRDSSIGARFLILAQICGRECSESSSGSSVVDVFLMVFAGSKALCCDSPRRYISHGKDPSVLGVLASMLSCSDEVRIRRCISTPTRPTLQPQ